MTKIEVRLGFPEDQIPAAAALYDEAFGRKMRPAIPDRADRIGVLADSIDPTRGFAAIIDGEVVGLAGFHDRGGSLTGKATFGTLHRRLGLGRALRAAVVLALLERKPKGNELLMDGIAVRADQRGNGIGTQLFDALEAYCRDQAIASIRLDVIDTNPDARRLYERRGFEAVRTERTPYLRGAMGFSAVTTMVKPLHPADGRRPRRTQLDT